jgi:hypothetical protein
MGQKILTQKLYIYIYMQAYMYDKIKQQTDSVACSPQANYIVRETAACRRS